MTVNAIILSTGDVSFPFGGKRAYLWSDCSSVSNNPVEVYTSYVEPWFTMKVNRDLHKRHVLPANAGRDKLLPGINILGGSLNDFPITESNLKMTNKSYGTYAEWEKAKRDGKIVLKPRTIFKMNALATPRIYAEKIQVLPEIACNFAYYGAGKGGSGSCNSDRLYRSIPELELDSYGSSAAHKMIRYDRPTIIPASKSDLDSLLMDIAQHLEREEPNGTLVTKVVAEANSATFDVATEIGELPETIKMIISFVKEGIRLLLRAKRSIKQNLSSGNVISDSASLWMATRYGLMPIVYSINDGLDLLDMEVRKFQSFRGRSDSPAMKFNARGYTCIESPQVQHRTFLKYGYDLESTMHQGLKFNLLATAWELVPLSFVFDWFFQVGDYLTAFFTPGAVDQIGCQYSYRVNGKYVFKNEDTNSIATIDVDYYRSTIINPDSFIGINSEVFVSYKRAIDAISLSWLLFKKSK